MRITPSRAAVRRIALSLALAAAAMGPAAAQGLAVVPGPEVEAPAVPDPEVDAGVDAEVDAPAAPALGQGLPDVGLPKGALVFHGNYCGPGSRGHNPPPVDALDRACMHHDACSPPVGRGLPPCSCNQRLSREASAVARDPATPDDLRVTADFVAEGAKAMACR